MAEAPAGGLDIRRIGLVGGVVIIIMASVIFFLFRSCGRVVSGGNEFQVVYSNLDIKDAANVVARLKEMAIPYEVKDDGRAIAVKKDNIDQARLGLAEENLPAGGVVGWEIFDESKLGATDFDRRIQLIRAISGELSRTIRRISAIQDARVQIVLPETRLFATNVAPVTASVMLRLKPGSELSQDKIKGIVYLVASSVENLQPENVTVIDDTGRILTVEGQYKVVKPIFKPAEIVKLAEVEEKAEEKPKEKEEGKEKEKEPEKKPLTEEEKVLLKVQAKRNLEKDLTGKAQEILNRFYPPNSVVVKTTVELANSIQKQWLKESDFKVKKLDTVILVDNRISLTQKVKQTTYKAVAAAVGYNRSRGDRIILQRVPFHLATPPVAVVKGEVERTLAGTGAIDQGISLTSGWLRNVLIIFVIALSAVIALMLMRLFRPKPKPVQMRRQPAPPRPTVRPAAVEKIKSAVDSDPEKVAEMLKKWLTEPE
ncbi:MAG: flagellar M-ring protein FliF [Candidatus Margulisbacteria bacterium]|nr:flagellar M-ring protein FliF [Candidatus Margulisiibacteriota bacterium]